jgi:hypothetical protein
MSVLGWWRKRMKQISRGSNSGRTLDDAAIAARVDLVRLEAFAEAAYQAMRECRPQDARSRYEESRVNFDGAIDAARRARLADEVTRLQRRRDQISQIYSGQMRYSGGG